MLHYLEFTCFLPGVGRIWRDDCRGLFCLFVLFSPSYARKTSSKLDISYPSVSRKTFLSLLRSQEFCNVRHSSHILDFLSNPLYGLANFGGFWVGTGNRICHCLPLVSVSGEYPVSVNSVTCGGAGGGGATRSLFTVFIVVLSGLTASFASASSALSSPPASLGVRIRVASGTNVNLGERKFGRATS